MPHRRIRIGIDVGGTFTKAVALDVATGQMVAKSAVPTTHSSQHGVSEGIVDSLSHVLDSGIRKDEIELVSHSTTQAINALLESDTHKVGIIAMGVGPTKREVIKRTRLEGAAQGLRTVHRFLDTSHMITDGEVHDALDRLRQEGAEAIVATEAYGVDDPSNEQFVTGGAAKLGLPSTSSHELSGIYGLEIRTLTAAINASVLPKTLQVADFVEDAIRKAGVTSPLVVMKGDGGITSMDTFRTKPILTILSGPAASVAGALLHLRITDGVFVEVGGTSTNICIIRGGRPRVRYAVIRDHPTCIRSMDVRILGVAGGSMVSIHRNRVSHVGPRSAHIAGLKYSCFADPHLLETGKLVMVRPRPDDSEYAAIRCAGETFAITVTCAANALGMVEEGDHAFAGTESARVAMRKLGERLGLSYSEIAMSIVQTASFEITKAVGTILKEFKMDAAHTRIIGGGGAASVLVPFAAKQIGAPYSKAGHAEVISSIGVASSMLHEELEVAMVEPTPQAISEAHRRIRTTLASQGAVPESITVESNHIPDKSILRVSAVGNISMDSCAVPGGTLTLEEATHRASEEMGIKPDMTELCFESDHYLVFAGHITQRRLLTKRNKRHILVLDRFGKSRLSVKNGRILQGGPLSIIEELDETFESNRTGVAPQVHLIDDSKMMDFSGLTSAAHILNAVRAELGSDSKAALIVEM